MTSIPYRSTCPEWPKSSLVPVSAIIVPYFLASPGAVRSQLLGYSGVLDHGWAASLMRFLGLLHSRGIIALDTRIIWHTGRPAFWSHTACYACYYLKLTIKTKLAKQVYPSSFPNNISRNK